ncbi:cupin-like domain-domain-containing protein [Protomyces lactucae-debilis]|uniref:Cupin-like domain-domain-containing protein n=1 Tax=Protomyces lactucae-debilis TaxID=2754530 RepID=A0A1Y2EYZ0_PROLT|nr:cupin-like domain-containing protein [Protomyces lactucae-debilis]ORY76326.1 cupin-like domain-domain-containing protein [Protomyces lactucae-debilis]
MSADGRFGTGASKKKMEFASLLQDLQRGEQLYLTAQYKDHDEDSILAEPLETIQYKIGFPVQPVAAGDLMIAKVNLWLGASKEERSSGCHHDFHDNFYCLLSGSKTFRLFASTKENTERLQLHGQIVRRFTNGLVAYDELLGSDGLTGLAKATIRLELCEQNMSTLTNVTGKAFEDAREALEAAEDDMLNCQLEAGVSAEEDDYEDDGSIQEPSSNEDTSEDEQGDLTNDDCPPPSFSTLSSDQVQKLVGKYGETISLERGEMLYLPASWFHEVISHSGKEDFHMALNYWFYPPDDDKGGYLDTQIFDELRRRMIQNSISGDLHGLDDLEGSKKRQKTEGI